DELRRVAGEIQALSSNESPRYRELRRERVAKLADLQEELEVKLSRALAASPVQQAVNRSAVDVRAALDPGTALVDLIEYLGRTPSPGGRSARVEPRVAAFVLRPDRPVVRVELGPSRTIADVIRRWQDAF